MQRDEVIRLMKLSWQDEERTHHTWQSARPGPGLHPVRCNVRYLFPTFHVGLLDFELNFLLARSSSPRPVYP